MIGHVRDVATSTADVVTRFRCTYTTSNHEAIVSEGCGWKKPVRTIHTANREVGWGSQFGAWPWGHITCIDVICK
jgi:hypothetical protein